MADPGKARVVLDSPSREGANVRLGARLIEPDGETRALWWEGSEDHLRPSDRMDPWLLGLLNPIMARRRGVHIEGVVSPSLLRNVEMFMAIWQAWRPAGYWTVEITADKEEEPQAGAAHAVVAVSGGLDSAFTIYRNAGKGFGRRTVSPGLGVYLAGLVHGLADGQPHAIERATAAGVDAALGDLGIPTTSISTNFRELGFEFMAAVNTVIASGLTLVGVEHYGCALLANNLRYTNLAATPDPVHPLTNTLLGGDVFPVIDDGGEIPHIEKARLVKGWPAGMANLRVCFEEHLPEGQRNCGRCEKCMRRALQFRAAGADHLKAIPADLSDRNIGRVRVKSANVRQQWRELGDHFRLNHEHAAARSIRRVLRRAERRDFGQRLEASLRAWRRQS